MSRTNTTPRENPDTAPTAGGSISAVERDTGISKDTLRAWERRYGFPQPVRDERGERLYPPDQIERLRLIRRLSDAGMRPSKIVRLDAEGLRALLDTHRSDVGDEKQRQRIQALMQLVRLHRSSELRSSLQQLLLKQGLQHFVCETLAPLNLIIGEAWLSGELEIPEEHLYTEQVQSVLRNAISSHTGQTGRPRVMLTTFPEELHSLGLLMAEACMVPEGAHCISLGTQLPVPDICQAARDGAFDIVALSFSAAYPPRQAVSGLNTLRSSLDPQIEIWAGGAALAHRQQQLPGITTFDRLSDTIDAVREWRNRALT